MHPVIITSSCRCAGSLVWYFLPVTAGLLLHKFAGQPVQALVQTLALRGARGLNVPPTIAHVVQSQFLRQFSCRHRVREVLFVGKDQNHSIAQLVLGQHVLQLLLRLSYALPVVRVDDKDESLRVLEVVPPQWTNLVLATHVPNGERNVLVLDCLDIESDRGNCRHDLTQLQFVQDCSLTGSIQTH